MTTPDPTPEAAPQAAGWLCDTEGHSWVWTWPIEEGEGSIGQCSFCRRVTTAQRDARIRAEALREAASGLHEWMGEPSGPFSAAWLRDRADAIEAGERP